MNIIKIICKTSTADIIISWHTFLIVSKFLTTVNVRISFFYEIKLNMTYIGYLGT